MLAYHPSPEMRLRLPETGQARTEALWPQWVRMGSGLLLPGSLSPSPTKAGQGAQTWGGWALEPWMLPADIRHSTPTFLAIPKTPHSSSLLALPTVGGGQWPGSELAAWGL